MVPSPIHCQSEGVVFRIPPTPAAQSVEGVDGGSDGDSVNGAAIENA